MSDQLVEVLVVRTSNVEIAAADIVDRFVVHQECTVRILDCAVRCKDSIVGLDDGSADSGGRVDCKFELAFFAVIGGKALEKECTKAGSSTTTEGVEDQKALQTGAVV